jgi:signal transduction histidine kinase
MPNENALNERPTILVVDDLQENLTLTGHILRNHYKVMGALDGENALRIARSDTQPDLILLDITMPGMDGYEVCQKLKADSLTRDIPVIFLTAKTDVDDEKQGFELGAVDYITKPVSPPIILARIRNHLKLNKLQNHLSELVTQRTMELKEVWEQIVHQEKMASIGQLAAGVAHEINNPMGFITSNLTSLGKYADRLDEYITAIQISMQGCVGDLERDKLERLRERLKVDYIIGDVRALVAESLDGANRVRHIVQDLKNFSRLDQVERCRSSLNEALETTINIAWNELKYIATLERDFGDIPDIFCYPGQLNQVFLNLLVNAAQAMEKQGIIKIRTWRDDDNVYVAVTDSGKGMTEEVCRRVFEPFYTTKAAGTGTGLGLSISTDIVRKHGGEITVTSEVGRGSTFTVRLPVVSTPISAN